MIGDDGSFSLAQRIRLDGKKVAIAVPEQKSLVNVFSGLFSDEFDTLLNSVVKDIPGAKLIATKKYHRTLLATGEEDIKDETKPFKVYCDDMFHYQDTDARLFIGSFATGEEAEEKCRAILRETLLSLHEAGMTAETLMTKWWALGDDPWISGPNDSKFSAATEAPAFAKFIVEQKEQELSNNK